MGVQHSWRLDAQIGWQAASIDHVSTSGELLGLAPLPGTARPIAAPSGAFAGLSTPLNVAVDGLDRLFLLDATGTIRRYDPCSERFDDLPCLQGKTRPAGLSRPIAIALHPAGELLVLDGETRSIRAIDLDSLRLKRSFGPFAWRGGELVPVRPEPVVDPATGVPTSAIAMPADAWDPRDLTALPGGRIAVSDRAAERIHLFDRRGHVCASWNGSKKKPLVAPGAVAADRAGRIYVVEQGKAAVAILGPDGQLVERTQDAEALKDEFALPAINVDQDGTLWISDRFTGLTEIVRRDCSGRCMPPQPASLTPVDCPLLAFDPDGHAILGDPRSPCLLRSDSLRYAAAGRLVTSALDSGQAGMVWDRLRISGLAPFGTELVIATTTSDIAFGQTEIERLPEYAWTIARITFEPAKAWTAAIRNTPGRYLWIRLDFASDGLATPTVQDVTVNWPRNSSMRFLPGTFAADPASADFLARFLGIFDQLRETMLEPIDRLPSWFDAYSTQAADAGEPGEDFLDWLAGWVGIALDRNWSTARRRRLVAEAPKLFRMRGTVAGLKAHIAVYTGIEPKLVEHFRLRRWLTLDESQLDNDAALWGPEIVKRLQLDGYNEISRFQLVDGGDPLTDPFDAFAHRATLYVPAGKDFGDADMAALSDVAEMAKPAHVDVDIRLMRPRFVVGCDLVLGVNTVLGRDSSPARTDESILGDEIRLAGPPPNFTLRSGLRLGTDTTLE